MHQLHSHKGKCLAVEADMYTFDDVSYYLSLTWINLRLSLKNFPLHSLFITVLSTTVPFLSTNERLMLHSLPVFMSSYHITSIH